MNAKKWATVFCVISLLTAAAIGCTVRDEETEAETEPAIVETETETETETEIETETETETDAETEPPLPDSAERLDKPDSKITGYSDDDEDASSRGGQTSDKETEEETEAEEETEPERIYNYLNGKTVTEKEQKKRPVAIMINNIERCLPQAGITEGDMFYECSAEGGITRIMMLTTDYENLPEVGSIRSSRDYFIDFIANHDAIYVHAGGSAQAYEKIAWRKINNLDGVNMYIPNMFYRDSWRYSNMGIEHSLMTTGEKIAAGIAFKGYRTELADDYVSPFAFFDETVDNQLKGSPASHVRMQSTGVQTVDFVYDEKSGEYLRYQYYGKPHVDANNDKQLSVKNVLILFTDIHPIPGDNYGRLTVGTVGSGQGYYITNGKRKVVNWSREGKTTPLHLEYRNGDELILNCGKTFICVVDNTVATKIGFEETW